MKKGKRVVNEDIRKKCELLEKQLEDLTNNITDEMISNASVKEKEEYLKLIAEIKTKIQILKSYK